MNIYQRFALNHFLSSYPEEWDYQQVIDAIDNEDYENITLWYVVENSPWEDIPLHIESMIDSLKETFKCENQ